MTRKPRLIVNKDLRCPSCGKLVYMKVERIVKTPGRAAETEIRVTVSKTTQKRLDE